MTVLFFLFIPFFVGIFYHFVFHTYIAIPFLIIASPLASLVFLALIVIIMGPFVALSSNKNRFKQKFMRSIAKFLAHLMRANATYEGLENIPESPFVVVGNHKSQADIIYTYIAIDKPLGFISKPNVFKVPVLSWYMKGIGCVAMHREDDREGAKDMLKAIKEVKNGFSMCVFPEGGRKNIETEKIVEYRAGAYKLATKPQVSIVPLTINNSASIKNNFPWRSTKIHVTVHKPITKEEYLNENTHELGDVVKDIINSSCTK